MIKPEELRAGLIITINNVEYWPDLNGIPFIVTGLNEAIGLDNEGTYSVSLKNPSDQKRYSQFIQFIEPIPLTEEWLEKSGFRNNKGSNVYWIPLSNLKAELHFEIYSSDTVAVIESDFAHLILDPIKSVHSLQNLIYSLTGKELTIKS